jgi:hypothetical protein
MNLKNHYRKMKKILSLALLAVLAIATGCSTGNDEPTPEPTTPTTPTNTTATLEINTASATPTFSSDGGTTQVTITTSSTWTADVTSSRASDWCTVSPTSGAAGTATLTITTQPNTTYDERNATITIKSGELTKNYVVTQKPKDAILLSTDKVEMKSEGGTFSVTVQANVTYDVKKSVDWISQVSSRSLNQKTLTFSVKENASVWRTGAVTLTNGTTWKSITVTQEGAKGSAGGGINDMPITDW